MVTACGLGLLFPHAADARLALGVIEGPMGIVEAGIHNTHEHPLARIGQRELGVGGHEVGMGLGAGHIQLGCHP